MLLTVQLLPSHSSVMFPSGPDPTAMQNSADEHDTADNWPKGIIGLGIGCTDQVDAPAPQAQTNATATTNSAPTITRDPRASAIRLNINGPLVRFAANNHAAHNRASSSAKQKSTRCLWSSTTTGNARPAINNTLSGITAVVSPGPRESVTLGGGTRHEHPPALAEYVQLA